MQNNDGREGNIFNVSVTAQALTTNQYDIFGFTADTGSRFEVLAINLGQSSSSPSGIQALGVQLLRGSTASSTSAAITPANTKGWSGAPTAKTAVTGPSTTLVSTTSAALVFADSFDAASGRFAYAPEEGSRQVVTNSQRLHLRVTAPPVGVTIHGNVTFRELGYGLPA